MSTTVAIDRLQLPTFLQHTCDLEAYRRWVVRRARAHLKRDRKRGNKTATLSAYKAAIHDAVVASEGKDAYTGLALDWNRISQYDNLASKEGRREYKKKFADLPTLDHVGRRPGARRVPDLLLARERRERLGPARVHQGLPCCGELPGGHQG